MLAKDLLQLGYEFETPLYVYDSEKIEYQYNRLSNAFSKVSRLRLNYACKALSNISVLQFIKNLGACLDTVSVQEVQLGLHAGFLPEQIIFTPNGVSIEEIEQAIGYGNIQVNIDNLSILEQFGAKYPHVPVCIRLNPHVRSEEHTSELQSRP